MAGPAGEVARWVVAGDVVEVMGYDLAVPLRCGPGDVHQARPLPLRLTGG